MIVLPADETLSLSVREQDQSYADFLDRADSVDAEPSIGAIDRVSNILFSSGTTGTPKPFRGLS